MSEFSEQLLYHYSEDPDIKVFAPRSPLARPEVEPMVWTIDAWHSPLYYLPRDCPRVCFWKLPTTTPEDRAWYEDQSSARMVIAIESAWLERVTQTRLFRYAFHREGFIPLEDHGVHVCKQTILPIDVSPVGNLLEQILAADVELRLCPSLYPLAQTIQSRSLHWSLIRMRNATPAPTP